ncbi:MAG: hypothetical protein ACTHJM_10285 [Marmoricola sp.]
MAKYLKLPNGTVHSVTDEDWENYHSVEVEGKRYPIVPGVTEIKEAEARKAHPALFGEPDARVVAELSMKEIKEAQAKADYLASLGVTEEQPEQPAEN